MMFELRIKLGRKVVFSKVCSLEECVEWIRKWNESSSASILDSEYTYTLIPKPSLAD